MGGKNEETAISVTTSDHGAELRLRRDGFFEQLYAPQPRSSENDDQIQIEAFDTEKLRSRSREEEKVSSSRRSKMKKEKRKSEEACRWKFTLKLTHELSSI